MSLWNITATFTLYGGKIVGAVKTLINTTATRKPSSENIWARSVLASNHHVILDCETTGIGRNDEIIQLAIIDMDGNTLFDSLIYPSPRKYINPKAIEKHGITRLKLKNAPRFPEVAGQIATIITGKTIITYNAAFDRQMLTQTLEKYPHIVDFINNADFDCAMLRYSAYIGEWSNRWQNYRWQKLPGGDHTAIGDCKATLNIIRKMAN